MIKRRRKENKRSLETESWGHRFFVLEERSSKTMIVQDTRSQRFACFSEEIDWFAGWGRKEALLWWDGDEVERYCTSAISPFEKRRMRELT